MHKLKSIEVTGFRGQKSPIKLALKGDANFLIGRNGTGKTTFINLVNAALVADINSLQEETFQTITLQFKSPNSRKIPQVTITKKSTDDIDQLDYSVRDSASAKAEVFHMLRPVSRRLIITPDGQRRVLHGPTPARSLKERLASIYKTAWLSLQRRTEIYEVEEFDDVEDDSSDVDQKLDQVVADLAKYFSRLDRLVAEQTQKFQKRWFLSFLASERIFSPVSMSKLDLSEERAALVAIFDKFSMTPDSYDSQLNKHFKLVERAKGLLAKKDMIPFKDMLVMFDTVRLHSLVEQWQKLQSDQKETYQPKTDFVKISSEMLFRKNVEVNRSNQVVINSDIGDNVGPRDLSSGEKQLLIFLSETLLQEQEPFIFLADEPELSLHVQWQEELVPNLLKINPNAQVFFATHSPDIVNVYQDQVFDMEKLVS